MKIAILLTCFNRKVITLRSLNALYEALASSKVKLKYSIYLTDDGSTDGTSLSVLEIYPSINILKGNGNLYWAGGMRNSWNKALENNYDGYLLLNDDTFVFEDLIKIIAEGIQFCNYRYKSNGILIGSTKDEETNKLTYGGSIFINKFLGNYKMLIPNNDYQECELGNANIMFVHKEVVNRIGILSGVYKHGVADYDYTYNAIKNNIPVIVLPVFMGYCKANTSNNNIVLLNLKSLKERYKFLTSPTGLALEDNLHFQKKYFPMRFFLVLSIAFFKLLFPRVYFRINAIRTFQFL